MEQALQQLNTKYDGQIALAQQTVEDANNALLVLQGAKSEKYKEIVAYYDALAKKAEVDALINGGEPII